MKKRLIAGDFNSEKFWRKKRLSKLPDIPNYSNDGIVLSMDEMLFPFCSKGDILATRFNFDKPFGEYLSYIGFDFTSIQMDFQTTPEQNNQSIYEIIGKDELKRDYLKRIVGDDFSCDTYAIVPGYDNFIKKLGIDYKGSEINVVRKVNSKVFSSKLSQKLDFSFGGKVVNSHEQLIECGRKLLSVGAFIIKDPFGVSGKGNVLVKSKKILNLVANYLYKQELQGFISVFILEPLLQKDLDFSCQIIIGDHGQIKLLGVQTMINHQFAYNGSCKASKEFVEFLKKKGYFSKMNLVAHALYCEGYTGEVCVDSMLLKSQIIIPVIEINARKSMGFINSKIDNYLCGFNKLSRLSFLNLGFSGSIKFEDILALMENQGLLFASNHKEGILPLSSNTLFINRKLDSNYSAEKIYHGRLYFSVISNNTESYQYLMIRFTELLDSLSLKIYSR